MVFRPAIGVVGANRFGICLAEIAARNGNDVVLFTSIPQRATSLRRQRKLPSKVPELKKLHANVHVTTDPVVLAERCSFMLLSMSRDYVGRIMDSIGGSLDGAHMVVHAVHSLEGPQLDRSSSIIREHTCVKQIGAIAGPAHVRELLSQKPNAAVVGSAFPAVVAATRRALQSDYFRIHSDPDIKGVELAAALSQVVTIAVGLADGAKMGPAAHATLFTRGLGEIATVGAALGAAERTFFGLAGVGRIVDALHRSESNYQLGHQIGSGRPTDEAVSEASGEAMGVRVIWRLAEFAAVNQLHLPICAALGQILDGELDPVVGQTDALLEDDAT
jgi:glycerol-3-phosphate dehydrogenase (NAD(P)+)